MDSIEERYTIMKTITGVTLVIALLITFANLLIRENNDIINNNIILQHYYN